MDSIHLCECGCGDATKLAPQSSTRQGWTRGQPMRFLQRHNGRRRRRAQEAPLCACGCGEKVILWATATKHPARWARYLNGHQHRLHQGPPRDELIDLYWTQELSVGEIAQRYGVIRTVVDRWFKRHSIDLRSVAEYSRVAGNKRSKRPAIELLRRHYFEEILTPKEIGQRYGVNPSSAYQWLVDAGFPMRTMSEWQRLKYDLKRPAPIDLREMYEVRELSVREIAASLGVSSRPVLRWLQEAAIRIRSSAEQQRIDRERRPLPPSKCRPISKRRRYAVLARDGFKCQACGRSPQTHDVVLEIDHIIPFSKGGTSDMDNLQSLCESCNRGKTDLLIPMSVPPQTPQIQN